MIKISVLIPLLLLFLCGFGLFTPMGEVINNCDGKNSEYNNYLYCIKMTYAKEGFVDTSDPVLRIFYDQLDMISGYKNQGKISNTQAKEMSREIYKDYLLYRAQYDKEKSNANWAAFNQSLNQSNVDAMRYREEFNRQLMNNIGRQNSNQLNCTSVNLGGITNTQCR
jgi:hypothetical protein